MSHQTHSFPIALARASQALHCMNRPWWPLFTSSWLCASHRDASHEARVQRDPALKLAATELEKAYAEQEQLAAGLAASHARPHQVRLFLPVLYC